MVVFMPSIDEFLERAPQAADAALAGGAVDDQLGDHAIVIRRHAIAGVEAAIDAHVHAAGRDDNCFTRPGEGAKVFGSSALIRHSIAWPRKLISSWRAGQALAAGDADLLAHEVDAGDHLGHRMLDLEPGVHLDEVEFAILVEELDRAGAAIAHVGHRLGDDAAHPVALGRRR